MKPNRFLAVNASEISPAGKPVTVWDEHSRIVFQGQMYPIPDGAVMRFDMNGIPITDSSARVWIEWSE